MLAELSPSRKRSSAPPGPTRFLLETAASTSPPWAVRRATVRKVVQSGCSACFSQSAWRGHASPAAAAAGSQLSGRGVGKPSCRTHGSNGAFSVVEAPASPIASSGGARGVAPQPEESTCGLARKARAVRTSSVAAPLELDGDGSEATTFPPPKQRPSSTRSEAPARVMPSCAGPTSSSVSTYGSASCAGQTIPPATMPSSPKSAPPSRALSRRASCTDSCDAAANQRRGETAPIAYVSHIWDQPIRWSPATIIEPRSPVLRPHRPPKSMLPPLAAGSGGASRSASW
mmetsp:Transcript_36120/g.120919  ORF Transcript_36120/g.120919 Transcript_36120/m.120919 type:complete len:287 (-) Transcript_36120:663-1523(-)